MRPGLRPALSVTSDHAVDLGFDVGDGVEQAGIEIDEQPRLLAAKLAHVENVQFPAQCVDGNGVVGLDQREEMSRRDRLAVALGADQRLESLDGEVAVLVLAENRLKRGAQDKRTVGRGEKSPGHLAGNADHDALACRAGLRLAFSRK